MTWAWTRLLIDEPAIGFLPSLAVSIGVNEAIALQQIHYLSRPRLRGEEQEPRWVRMPIEVDPRRRARGDAPPCWTDEFPFWSPATIRRTLRRLRDGGWVRTEVVAIADGLGRETQVRVDYATVGRLVERLAAQSGQSDKTGAQSGQCDQINQVNVTRLPNVKREREERGGSADADSTLASLDEKRLHDSVVIVLARWMARAILDHNPRAQVPALESKTWVDRWLTPIRLMWDRDGYSPDEIRAMITWSQADQRERAYTRSPDALRRNRDTIVAKMQERGVPPFGGGSRGGGRQVVRSSDLAAAMNGGAAA